MIHSTYHWIHSMDFMQQKADALTQSGVFSGIEWRVDQHAETLFAGRSGAQDVETGSGIPDQAVYRIYSMTKPIVSVLALILIEQGVFRLNTPLSELRPATSIIHPERTSDKTWQLSTATYAHWRLHNPRPAQR
ncbi:MAG: class A beta-lactamase-related serine hydrolase [Rhodobacteraceae bacterium]|nr:class A beta-lactamase-related serine hydrolase [Paracoccaceae bacterium]